MTICNTMFDAPAIMAHREIHLNHLEAKKKLIVNRPKEEWIKDFLTEKGIHRLKASTYYELFEDAKLYSFLQTSAYWFEYDEEIELDSFEDDFEESHFEMCQRHSDDEDESYYAKLHKRCM